MADSSVAVTAGAGTLIDTFTTPSGEYTAATQNPITDMQGAECPRLQQ